MKNLILLFLVIGAVVSQVTLTTGATVSPEWTLTYATPTGEDFYSYTITFGSADDSEINLHTSAAALFAGVVCLETDATFDHTTVGPGWAWTIANANDAVSKNTAVTNYAALALTYFPALDINDDEAAGSTGNNGVLCAATAAAGAAAITSSSVGYVTTGINSCGNLKATGVAFYAKCYHIVAQSDTIATTGVVAIDALTTGTNVTVTATAATTCATTGASTFATGATILAGIAYLQF
jgi:hypothetical protein